MANINNCKKRLKDYYVSLHGLLFANDDANKKKKDVLINEVLQVYKNPLNILKICNKMELNILKKVYIENKEIYNSKLEIFLLTFDFKKLDELEESVKKAIELSEDKNFKFDMEKSFYLVGLVRLYGCLTFKEINNLFKEEYQEDVDFMDLYLRTSVIVNDMDEIVLIPEVFGNVQAILKTHGKQIKTKYDKDLILSVGEEYLTFGDDILDKKIRSLGEYNKICGSVLALDYMTLDQQLDGILEADEKFIVFETHKNYPNHLLNDNAKDRLSKEDVDLFYSVFPKYLYLLGQKYKMNVGTIGALNPDLSLKALTKEYDNNFKHMNLFIKSNHLSLKQEKLITSLKNGLNGDFIIVKYVAGGAIMQNINNLNFYLVKGLISSFEQLIPSWMLPVCITTFIFPYEDFIVCSGLIAYADIDVPYQLKKGLEEEYKKHKSEIITKAVKL